MNHFDRIEANEVQKVLDWQGKFSSLVLEGQALAKSQALPAPLRHAMVDITAACDDVIHDNNLSAAIDRYEERQAEHVTDRSDELYDLRRDEALLARRTQAAAE